MTSETFKGSCLCGEVQYELTGEPTRFYHCHCERCRKATGTGHASNIMVKDADFNWISGSELLRRFNVPNAERFYTYFCSHCGSGMPREIPELGLTLVPAGSLDDEPSVQPNARIFWDSRSKWSCDGNSLVSYPEYEE